MTLDSLKNSIQNYFRPIILFKFLPIILSLHLAQSISINKPLPTRYYQPQFIQIGSKTVLLSDDQNLGTVQFDCHYIINLQRLQLQNRADYVITTSFRSLHLQLQNHDFVYVNWHSWSSITTSSFVIRIYFNHQNLFSHAKFNYVAISQVLLQPHHLVCNQLSTYWQTNPLPPCDGRITKKTCRYEQTFYLNTIGYKVFYHVITFHTHLSITSPEVTFYTVKVEILSTSKVAISYTAEYIYFYYITCDIILIKNEYFDTSQRKKLMFSYVTFTHEVTSGNSYSFSYTFNHHISDINLFVGLIGYKGNQYSYEIGPNLIPNNSLVGTIDGFSYSGQFYAIGIYAYTNQCPSSMKMPCSQCPPYCKTCDVAPIFHCAECQNNFMISPDKQSCICPLPLLIVNDYCDKFPFGCNIAQLLPNGISQCVSCDLSKKLWFDGSTCLCKKGFTFDSSNVCQQICGDGQVFQSECDDGNTISGDGCSSTCFLEPGSGLLCDKTVIPAVCKSQVFLKYQIKTILKNENANSVEMVLEVSKSQFLPFPLKIEDFVPISSYIRLEITTEKRVSISNLFLKQIGQNKELTLIFDYNFNLQEARGQLNLNYSKTLYKNETQKLKFIFKGDNYALNFDANSETYKSMGTGMLLQTILYLILLLVGLISPKFIGLESIITLQSIFYSQLLILNASKIPPGFVFLKSLKYVSGYNQFIQWSGFQLESDLLKKMNLLAIKKLIIQNFNANFLILLISFTLLAIISFLVRIKTNAILNQNYTDESICHKDQKITQNHIKLNPEKINSLKLVSQLHQKIYTVSNQIAFWLLLPIFSALSGQLLIPNNQSFFINQKLQAKTISKINSSVVFLSLTMILFIGLNNFKNLWLGIHNLNKLAERYEELKYKTLLYVYLFIMGFLIFFLNQINIFGVYASIIVLLIHTFYLLALIKIDPYRQSLTIHKVGLIFTNLLFLLYLVVINLINYFKDIDNLIILLLGYVITFGCGLVMIFTIARLYYELRYGEELEKQIQEERAAMAKQAELKRQEKLRMNENRLEEQAKKQQTEAEKQRDKNPYLAENMQRHDDQMDYLEWLECRNLDEKVKDEEYFKKYTEKPLKWLQVHDKPKYSEKMKDIEEMRKKESGKLKKRSTDPEYQNVMERLKNQFMQMKRKVQLNISKKK